MSFPSIITVDGPAASGKSTLGKKLAECYGYLFFDTGVMYRALTWLGMQTGMQLMDESATNTLAETTKIDVRPTNKKDGRVNDVWIEGHDVTWDIREPEVDANVSIVSAYPGVRTALSMLQREIGLRGKVVMVGRDIGTVVLPEAEIKIYLEASLDERARRRYREFIGRGEQVDLKQIKKAMAKRDRIDSTRQTAPLRPAEDAIVINSDNMSQEELFQFVKKLIENKDQNERGNQ
jgi:cytidylate kinase